MLFKLKLIILGMSIIIMGGQVYANRLTLMPTVRCDEANKQVCKETASFFKKQKCITDAEEAWLNSQGYMPVCKVLQGKLVPTGICPCGCFHPNTKISVLNLSTQRELEVSAMNLYKNSKDYVLAGLSSDSNLDNFIPKFFQVKSKTKGPEKKPLIVIQMDNHRILKLTSEHRVMLKSGQMIKAKSLDIGHRLYSRNGDVVNILNITTEVFTGDVYNFSTNASYQEKTEHLIIAEDVIVGDLLYQNTLKNEENAINIRK